MAGSEVADRLTLEPALGYVVRRRCQQLHQQMAVLETETAEPTRRRQQGQQIHDSAAEIGRRFQPLGADHLPDAIHRGVKAPETFVVRV